MAISEKVYGWCHASETVSSEYAKDPTPPGAIAGRLYGSEGNASSSLSAPVETEYVRATAEDLQRAYQCGKFGSTQPSELFLRARAFLEQQAMIYAD